MIFMAVDLEMNQSDLGSPIIQIGAVVGDVHTGQILEQLNVFIKIEEQLNPFIVKLTGITDDMLQKYGTSLLDGYQRLTELHRRHGAFMNCITWGGNDCAHLRQELKKLYPNDELNWPFGHRHIDVKTIHTMWALSNGHKMQGGLAKAMTKHGLKFQGAKHDAADDALNTFLLLQYLLPKLRTKR